MGKAGFRSNPGQISAIPIGISLKILVAAARCQRKARLWKLSQKNGWPLVRTANHQFNAENEVFETVRAEIWKTSLLWTRCFMRAREGCMSSVCELRKIATKVRKNAKNRGKMRKIAEKCEKSRKNAEKCEKSRKIAKKCEKSRKKFVKKRQLMGWSASYGVASYGRMYCEINRLGAQSHILGGRKIGVQILGVKNSSKKRGPIFGFPEKVSPFFCVFDLPNFLYNFPIPNIYEKNGVDHAIVPEGR